MISNVQFVACLGDDESFFSTASSASSSAWVERIPDHKQLGKQKVSFDLYVPQDVLSNQRDKVDALCFSIASRVSPPGYRTDTTVPGPDSPLVYVRVHPRDPGSTPSDTYLAHIVSHYDTTFVACVSAARKEASPVPVALPMVVFVTDALASRPPAYAQVMMQDAAMNGTSKSMMQVYDAATMYKEKTDEFVRWLERDVARRPLAAGSLTWWPDGMFAAQVDSLVQRPLAAYESFLRERRDWVQRAWAYIADPSPVDYGLVPYPPSCKIKGDQKEAEEAMGAFELAVFSTCRVVRKRVLIGVFNDAEAQAVTQGFSARNPLIMPFRVPDLSDPRSQGILFCSCVQQQPYHDRDVIMFNDGHGVLCSRGGLADHVARVLTDPSPCGAAYLAPHRHQLQNGQKEREGGRRFTREAHGFECVLSNSKTLMTRMNKNVNNDKEQNEDDNEYYRADDVVEAYAGTFIVPFKTFRGILFTVHHKMPSQSSDFSMFYNYGSKCLKTSQADGLYTLYLTERSQLPTIPPMWDMLRYFSVY
jgi:hypothetical protein